MTLEFMIVVLAGVAIAWANGSNDVSKGNLHMGAVKYCWRHGS